jgi:hypothetical protein
MANPILEAGNLTLISMGTWLLYQVKIILNPNEKSKFWSRNPKSQALVYTLHPANIASLAAIYKMGCLLYTSLHP